MRKLKLVGCSDPMMWYAGLVGQLVPLLREENDVYLSREPEGYTNIVRKADAQVVWVDQDGNTFGDGDVVRCACGDAELWLSRNAGSAWPVGPGSALLERLHTLSLCGAHFEQRPHAFLGAAAVREAMESGAAKGREAVLRYGGIRLRVSCRGIKWYHLGVVDGRKVDLSVEEFDEALEEALGRRAPADPAKLIEAKSTFVPLPQ